MSRTVGRAQMHRLGRGSIALKPNALISEIARVDSERLASEAESTLSAEGVKEKI